jgi:hypothetical protein
MKSSSTHAEGHFRQGSKEQQGLLVKSFKLVPRPSLDKGPETRQIKLWFSIHGIILEGNQLVQTNQKKKGSFEESSWFGEPKCKLRLKVAHFFIVFFYLCSSNFVRMEDILWIEDIVESTPVPSLSPILELAWLVLCIFTRWLLKWMHF